MRDMANEPAATVPSTGSQVSRAADVVLEVSALAKAFGATQALDDCSMELRRGEVHAIMGENGSGKSTLVKVLSGVHRPDAGTVTIDGDSVGFLASPRAADAAGIATVFQEILAVGQQAVLENVWLGSDGLLRRRIPKDERVARAREVLGELIDVPRLDMPANQLALSDRQATCIARALVREPRVLILDEATSALDVATRERLFGVLDRLRSNGASILFISHRMDEVEEIADRVTVLRSGRSVATLRRGEATPRELVRLMTGAEDAPADARSEAPARASLGASLVRTSGVRLHETAEPIDVDIRAGELVGIAGLEGHGQDRFLRVLAGARPFDGAVVCATGEQERELRSPGDALAQGIAYVPRDRRSESIFESRSILENFQLATVDADRRRGLVRRSLAERRFERYAQTLRIVAGHRTNPITSLSGGNQQKIVIARWLAMHPKVLLLNDPTRGVDAGTKKDIYRVLTEAAAQGTAIVMLSTELIELIELMDRVLVFREGQLFTELARSELSRTRLVESYFGRSEA
jgi:ABC-type sugar transport system ATPase subunit